MNAQSRNFSAVCYVWLVSTSRLYNWQMSFHWVKQIMQIDQWWFTSSLSNLTQYWTLSPLSPVKLITGCNCYKLILVTSTSRKLRLVEISMLQIIKQSHFRAKGQVDYNNCVQFITSITYKCCWYEINMQQIGVLTVYMPCPTSTRQIEAEPTGRMHKDDDDTCISLAML